MLDPDVELAQIVARAAPLEERLSRVRRRAREVTSTATGEARFERWASPLTRPDSLGLRNRLEWAGWNEVEVRSALESPPEPDSEPLPRWAPTLAEIIAAARELAARGSLEHDPDRVTFPLDQAKPIAFEEVLLPVVLTARAKLLARLGSAGLYPDQQPLSLFSESAYRELERGLLANLATMAGRALEAEFSRFRPAGHTLLRLLVGDAPPAGTASYRTFAGTLLESGLLELFRVYPVLARLVATAADSWVDATAELCCRLERDLPEIDRFFRPVGNTPVAGPIGQESLGKVIEIRTDLSDPHRGGRTVSLLTFDVGFRVIYKPRSLGMEVAFNRLLEWCNDRDVVLPLKTFRVFERQGYGWVEHVEQAPCADEAAGRRFYRRAGALLCLVHALRGTDCHWENVIANGEHPVLVDAETLLHPDAPPMDAAEEAAESWLPDGFDDSVVRTGLLPCWQFDEQSSFAHDASGLGGVDVQQSSRRVLCWKSINRDDIHLTTVETMMPRKENAAVLNGLVLSPNDHVEEIISGFSRMYRFLLAHREALLASDGPIARFASQRCRFVLRPTQTYISVLHLACDPDSLRDGADRSIALDALSRGLVARSQKPRAWSIVPSELRALEGLDIPYFEAAPDSRFVSVGPDHEVEDFFDEASYPQALALMRALDALDLEHQVAIIRGSFSAKASSAGFAEALSGAGLSVESRRSDPQAPALGGAELLSAAHAIAAEIETEALRARDGTLRWISLGQVPSSDRYQLQPLGPGLYDGYCGVALFLAALDFVARTDRYREITLGCLRSLRDALRSFPPASSSAFARRIGLGGATGLGSIVYALTRTSRFLSLPDLLEDAGRAASWISSELIAADRDLDIVGGSAGAILGLLSLYGETGKPAELASAIECGRHLLERRVHEPMGARAWKSAGTRPLTGFSHGAAGIGYALLRLYQATGDRIWLDAAREGIDYERSVFSPAAQNWPDFRESRGPVREPRFMVSWCHGAPGIGLGRLGCLPSVDGSETREEIEVALQATRYFGLTPVDHLCCGNFGRIEVLQVAARRLSRPELAEEAQRQTASLVARAEEHGSYRLLPELPHEVFSPGFFRGTSGIGYQLLRTAFPELLPSILLWE
jgi:type 2 lantibiotic biosynthesis protein LanM